MQNNYEFEISELNELKSNHTPFMILLVIYLISLVFSVVPFLTELRYIKYMVAFFAPFFLLPRRTYFKFLDEYLLKNIVLYLVVISISLINILLREDMYSRFFEESVFILTPAIFTYFLFRYYDNSRKNFYIKFLFWGIVITYLITIFGKDLNALSYIMNPFNFLINEDRPSGASSHAFYFPFFIIYFFFKKDKKYLLLSILFFLLSIKRISLFGLVLAFVLYAFYKKNEFASINKKVFITVALVLNIIIVFVVYHFTLGEYDYIFNSVTGRFSDDVASGRKGIYLLFFEKFDINNLPLLGVGIGKVMEVISKYAGFKFNFHSDILKNYTEMGPVVFLGWVYFLYRINMRNLISLMYIIYINTLFITDNAFVYFDVLFLFYFFIGISIIEQHEEENQIIENIQNE